MKTVAVGTTAGGDVIVAAGPPRARLMLANAGAATIFLKFDGSATALTTANGFPLIQNAVLDLSGKGVTAVRGIVASATVDCRVAFED